MSEEVWCCCRQMKVEGKPVTPVRDTFVFEAKKKMCVTLNVTDIFCFVGRLTGFDKVNKTELNTCNSGHHYESCRYES